MTFRPANDTNPGNGPALLRRARERRREALVAQAHCVVTTTRDGRETREHLFDQVPTLGALLARVGPDAFVVAVRMERPAARALSAGYALAAE